jgi:hypothetical protein
MKATSMLHTEFDRQLQNLLFKGYPALAGISEAEFVAEIEPLRKKLSEISASENTFSFVIVIKQDWISAEQMMSVIEIQGKKGMVNMTPLQPSDFSPIESLETPEGKAYLLIDVQTGHETLNVTPAAALQKIIDAGRTPLTIDEGVALLTQFSETLTDKENYNAFSMLGSRRGDKRVPAIWISYGQPRLGWCWNENPHTWLGSASAKGRLGRKPT